MKIKIFILAAVLIIAGILYASIRYWQIRIPNDSVSDWKTYANTQYGYSISYPPNYSITTTDYCDNRSCELREPTSSSHEVTIERPPKNGGAYNEMNRDVVLISLSKKSEEYFYVSPGERPLSFEGYRAKIVEGIAGELQTKNLVIDRGDYIFHLSADYNLTNGGVSFDILSTFKFTK